jgi:hypothetical protein
VRIEPATPHDAGEIMTVQRAAYVSEAQLYDNPHLSALSEPVESVRTAIESEVVLVARLGPRIVGLTLHKKVGYEQTHEERVADTLSLIHMEKATN